MTTWEEWIAALTGLVCVWLTVKNRLSNWPWGIVSVLAYTVVFWKQHAYASCGLNLLYFFPCCVYGWWFWAKCGPTHNDDLPVRRLSPRMNLAWAGITLALTLAIGLPIAHFTNDPIPYPDALATGMSIVAQWMQAKKWFENWYYWIAVDVLYVGFVYPALHLYLSLALYLVFLAVAVRGAIAWKPLIVAEPVDA
jgi:nicotinamide mononucleotide transporter